MNSMPLLSSPLAHAIGWALLHLLWQGVVVAGILAVTLKLLAKQSANTRYSVSCAALALLLVLGVATAYRAYDPVVPQPMPAAEETVKPIALADVPKIIFAAEATETVKSQAASLARSAKSTLPWIVLTWLVGVVVLSSRLMIGWMQTRRIARREAQPAGAAWQRTARRLSDALQLRRAVTLLESKAVEVPSVIGWLRPVVLLPASTLTGLTPEHIEMVLAHELAHIRRHDFFVNLLQAFVETLMFYHPAVWWISSRVRIERENCCDDLAVAVCGNPIQYARALTRLEELRANAPAIAVAANGGSLLERVRRIAASRHEATASTSRWAAAIALLAIIGIALVVPAIPALAERQAAATAPKPSTTSVQVIAPHAAPVPVIDPDDIDVDVDVDSFDFDIEAPEPPEVPEVPEMPEPPEMPEVPEAPEPPDFDFDVDFDAAIDVAAVAPVAPMPATAPMPAPAPAIAFAHADDDDDDHDDADDDDDRDHDRRGDRRERRGDGSLSVDDLVTLRSTGVTPEYINEMRALYPNASLGEIAGARSLGITRAYVESLRTGGVKVESLNTVKKLRSVGVTPEHIRSLRTVDADATIDEIVSARSTGVTAEYVQSLRSAGFAITDLRDAARFKAVGVTPEYARELRSLYPNVTAREIAEARSVGIDRAYVDSMRGAGIEQQSLRDLVRLRAVGVTVEYIKEMRAAGVKINDAGDVTKLRSLGVRADFVRRLAAAGYTNLSVRELTRLAAAGVDEEFIKGMQKYRSDKN